jgi:hypothetical protein
MAVATYPCALNSPMRTTRSLVVIGAVPPPEGLTSLQAGVLRRHLSEALPLFACRTGTIAYARQRQGELHHRNGKASQISDTFAASVGMPALQHFRQYERIRISVSYVRFKT